jgi:hypothetical protein
MNEMFFLQELSEILVIEAVGGSHYFCVVSVNVLSGVRAELSSSKLPVLTDAALNEAVQMPLQSVGCAVIDTKKIDEYFKGSEGDGDSDDSIC